ncbi:hypothetical protein BX592_103274 [Paraburkholderia rhizosphaerae]|uniref:Uncharacterized protein n=1 Tax=Paraburkholderia rhizosphaerae TaxID=480658 RepID=A0A4R8M1U6_9BURK|nr:hypothetical protein BX592_103274 [Paraburkholderia rhizosphaerae]
MHVASAPLLNAVGVIIAMAFFTPLFVRARSLLHLAPALAACARTVHPSHRASRPVRHPIAYD